MKNNLSSRTKNYVWLKPLAHSFLFMAVCFFTKNAIAMTFDIPSIFFKEKAPSVDGKIENSLSVYDKPLEILKNDALAIPTLNGHFNVKIVGYTDDKECIGYECRKLSLRRAQLIYQWMLKHGVPSNQLLPPEGHANEDPVGNNSNPDGREKNRRVEFQWIPISPKP